MQMSQVGKDQAIEKEGAALTASIKSAEEQKKRDEAKEAIKRPDESEAGAQPVKDSLSGGAERRGPGPGQAGVGPDGEAAKGEAEDEVVRDPSLGAHIDLTG
jgi:hypothetical protein